ncbi:MAG: DUF1592 domain-containing protein [Bryobacterales bacterium]
MTDLLGYEMDYSRDIPPDGLSRDGFRNNGSALRMSAIQLEYYLDAARRPRSRSSSPTIPEHFVYEFTESNLDQWLMREEQPAKNIVSRTDAFLGHMDPCYPEEGEFVVRVTAAAELKSGHGPPIMQVSVGFRPDTKILFRTAGTVELTSDQPQTFEFRGQMENFPQPVRGQSKFPGLVVRVTNIYDDGTPRPEMKTRKEGKKNIQYYEPEPDYPKVRVDKVVFEGAVWEQWPPERHTRILFDSELRQSDPDAYVAQVLEQFLARAWLPAPAGRGRALRRLLPSDRARVPRLRGAHARNPRHGPHQPQFLYLMEPDSESKRPLDDWELASRLSYLLWSTMPDERLFTQAAEGRLTDPQTLSAEVSRMLADQRAERFVDQFVGQWLYLEGMDRVAVSQDYYPNFRPNLAAAMRAETQQFVLELLRNDLSAANLIDSDFLVLNETSHATTASPAFKARPSAASPCRPTALAAACSRNPPCCSPTPPAKTRTPSSAPSGFASACSTIRLRLRRPTSPSWTPKTPTSRACPCANSSPSIARTRAAPCHVDIDPWGVALEHFDAIGQWRDEIRRMRPAPEGPAAAEGADEDEKAEKPAPEFDLLPVDARETLPDGTTIAGVDDLRAYLLGPRRHDFARTLVKRLLAYSLGRSLELADEKEVDRLTADFLAHDMKMRTLVEQIVTSNQFRTK